MPDRRLSATAFTSGTWDCAAAAADECARGRELIVGADPGCGHHAECDDQIADHGEQNLVRRRIAGCDAAPGTTGIGPVVGSKPAGLVPRPARGRGRDCDRVRCGGSFGDGSAVWSPTSATWAS